MEKFERRPGGLSKETGYNLASKLHFKAIQKESFHLDDLKRDKIATNWKLNFSTGDE
jgi:hypothetical protein